MDVTDVVGSFGPWQKTILAIIIFRAIPLSFIGSAPLLFVTSTDYWCSLPHNVSLTRDEWQELAIPEENGKRSRCSHYLVTFDKVGNLSVDTNTSVPCKEWEYDSQYGKTLIKEFNLVCDDSWMIAFTHTALKLGNLVGFLPSGYIIDKFGRKRVAMWSFSVLLILNTVTAFSPTYTFYLIMRFLVGLLYPSAATASLCLLMEVLGPEHRSKVSFSFIGGWGIGLMLVPGLYWVAQDWKHNQLILSIPFTLILLALLGRMVPESVRWLLTTQRDERAEQIIEFAAKKNGLQLDHRDVYMNALKEKIKKESSAAALKPSILDLLKRKSVRKWSLVMFSSYFLLAFVYFGFMLTVQALGANMFLTVFLMGLTEILAVGVYVICDRFRRKRALLSLSLFTAVAYLSAIPVPDDLLWLRLILSMAGRLTNIVLYNLIWIVSAEVFPTTHRSLGINGCMTGGRLGTILSTFLVSVAQTAGGGTWLLILYGVIMGLSSLLYLLLPETKGKHLPDTLADTNELTKSHLVPQVLENKTTS